MTERDPRRELDDPDVSPEWRRALDAGRADLPTQAQLDALAARVAGAIAAPGAARSAASASGGRPLATHGWATRRWWFVAGAAALATWAAVRHLAHTPATRPVPSLPAPSGAAATGGAARVLPARSAQAVAHGERLPEPTAPSGIDGSEQSRAPRAPANAEDPGARHESSNIGAHGGGDAMKQRGRSERASEAGRAGESEPARLPGTMQDLALLRRAESALLSAPSRALRLAEEHAQRFSTSPFVQERELIAILALLRKGHLAAAREREAVFRARYPHSVHLHRLQRELADPKNGEQGAHTPQTSGVAR